MGRRAARLTRLGLSLLGLILFAVFVLPRWWVLTGDIPGTLATVGRIVAGFPIAAAAIPVALTLQRSIKEGAEVPELALRLRAWSGVLHVVAGVLMILTAIAEIWLTSPKAGPWLFGVYGAAVAIALLAILAFVLSFVAEKPPLPPKPPKAKKEKRRGRGKKKVEATEGSDEGEFVEDAVGDEAAETAEETTESEPVETEAVEETPVGESEKTAEVVDTETAEETTAAVDDAEPTSGLKNKRPSGKRHRLRR